jgi:hypothetical protein
MLSTVQVLLDQNGQPQFAVLPYRNFQTLVSSLDPSILHNHKQPSLLSADRKTITLPNGGPNAHIDLVRFADYCDRYGIIDIAVNQRAQSLGKFPVNQCDTLDPFIRRHFLAPDSPYKNTMQAVTDVVDALVESGLFRNIKKKYEYFYRPVNAIEVCEKALVQFLQEQNRPKNPIRR